MSSSSSEDADVATVDPVLNTMLSVCVVILMLGLGASLEFDDIRKTLKKPKPLLIGMVSQFGFMPAMCFALGRLFNFNRALSLSLIVVGSCPGGTTSNLFAYWSNGDVALSVSMTAFSSTLALGFLPLLLWGYSQPITGDNDLKVDYLTLSLTLLGVLIPVTIGIACNARYPKYGVWLTRAGSLMGFVVVLFLIIYGSTTQSFLYEQSYKVYLVSILVGILGFSFGYIVSVVTGLNKRQRRTVALETGIQNGPLAIAIVELSFGKSDPDMLIIPFFYSVWIVIESIFLALYLRSIPVEKPIQRKFLDTQVTTYVSSKGETIYRSRISGDGLTSNFPPESGDIDPPPTLYHNFLTGLKLYGECDLLGYRESDDEMAPYVWITYSQVHERARNLGSYLVAAGATPKSTIGIFSINRWEWIVADLACAMYSLVSVPLYDTLGNDAVRFIIGKTEMKFLICSHDKLGLARMAASDSPSLKTIVFMDTGVSDPPASSVLQASRETGPSVVPAQVRTPPGLVPESITGSIDDLDAALAKEGAGGSVMPLSEAMRLGSQDIREPVEPAPDDLATICFTSGTTGVPKGAMLSNANIVATASASLSVANGDVTDIGLKFGNEDAHLSYLPLAHMFERILMVLYLRRGVRIGFYSGDIKRLTNDVKVLRPTVFASVPRLLSRMHDRILTAVDQQTKFWDGSQWPPFPRLRKWLFYKGYESKKKLLLQNMVEDGLWDNVVFSNIADRLGGRIRVVITGSAPLSPNILEFFRIVLSAHVVEGYGQTECAAASNFTLPGDTSLGHVGPPLPSLEIKLVDVPDMNFLTTDEMPRGEVCFRGPAVFQGYFDEEALTAEVIDEDGWLHSGDIGRINPTGTLSIIDRKRNVFKLAQGEFIAPEKIENVMLDSALFAQIWVYGHPLRHELVAVVIPDASELLSRLDAPPTDFDGSVSLKERDSAALIDNVISNPQTKSILLAAMKELGKAGGLHSFEIPKAVHIDSRPWTPESGLVTPTQKLRRHDLVKFYQKEIDLMYAEREAVQRG